MNRWSQSRRQLPNHSKREKRTRQWRQTSSAPASPSLLQTRSAQPPDRQSSVRPYRSPPPPALPALPPSPAPPFAPPTYRRLSAQQFSAAEQTAGSSRCSPAAV